MSKPIRIVTDSSAQFTDPSMIQRYHITVIPLEVQFPNRLYREGVDLTAESFFRQVSVTGAMPLLVAPSAGRFAEVYAGVCRDTDQILSLHLSRQIHPTWSQAKAAANTMLGRFDIEVMDSQTTSVGLGMLVEAAARLAETTPLLPDLVRIVRKLLPRVYSVFFVETLDYLQRGKLISESQAVLGAMLGMKPFVTIEDGELIAIEKVRTRAQAIDKLVEYVIEFGTVERLALLHNSIHISEPIRALRERLETECSLQSFPVVTYQPSLGCLLGPDALGVSIYEGDADFEADDNYDQRDIDEE